MPSITLSFQDIVYAAVLAFFFTWLILNISNVFQVVISRPTEFAYQLKDVKQIIQKCYRLFPNEIIQFQGKTFTRGMIVRVITNQKKTFEGELIGLNHENMLCVLTSKSIVAHELENIQNMDQVDKVRQA